MNTLWAQNDDTKQLYISIAYDGYDPFCVARYWFFEGITYEVQFNDLDCE